MDLQKIKGDIIRQGWHLQSAAGKAYVDDLSQKLGLVVSRSDIKAKKGSSQFIHGIGYIEFHTDDPRADLVIWLCIEPATVGGENILKDLRLAYRKIDRLHQISLEEMKFLVNLPGAPITVNCVEHRGGTPSFYYAPWKGDTKKNKTALEALFFLTLALSQVPEQKINMIRDDVLIINNRRLVHGRAPYEGNQRHLVRTLVALDDESWVHI